MDILMLAIKNLNRNKRRALFNIIAVAVGVTLVLVLSGWIRGVRSTLYNSMINLETGHLQILNKDYLTNQLRFPLDMNVTGFQELKTNLKTTFPQIQEVSGRVEFPLTMSAGSASIDIIGRGIEPENENRITGVAKYVKEGSFFIDTLPGVLIGEPVAKKMHISLGDHIFIRATDKYGSINLIDVPVRGIFLYKYPIIDENVVFFSLPAVEKLLSLNNEVTRIVIKLKKGSDNTALFQKKIAAWLKSQHTIYEWKTFGQVVVSQVTGDITMLLMIFGVVVFLVAFGIFNTMAMGVQERTREIGTLRAMGMKKKTVQNLFLAEAFWIGVIAAVIGILVGGGIAAYLQFVGVDLASTMPKGYPIPFGRNVYGDYQLIDFLLTATLGLLISLLGGLFPARNAAKVQIAETLRHIIR